MQRWLSGDYRRQEGDWPLALTTSCGGLSSHQLRFLGSFLSGRSWDYGPVVIPPFPSPKEMTPLCFNTTPAGGLGEESEPDSRHQPCSA